MVKQETIDRYTKYIGKNIGCLHIDDIDLSSANKNRIYFLCTCNICGSKLRIRNDGIGRKRDVPCCKNCIGNWRKEHFKELYKDKPAKVFREKYTHFKANAITRGIGYFLTLDDVVELCSSKCHYCGKEYCLGIDRVDNSKPYTRDNCVPCCGCCNKMKMDLEFSFFLNQIEKIYNNLETIKSSTTISKEGTSKTFVDGNGVHLSHRQ